MLAYVNFYIDSIADLVVSLRHGETSKETKQSPRMHNRDTNHARNVRQTYRSSESQFSVYRC